MAKHYNTVILSILEEARTAASEAPSNIRSAALLEVAKAYDQLVSVDGEGNIIVDNDEES